LKKILDNKIVVGHSLEDDLRALKLEDGAYTCELREISEFSIFKRPCYGSKHSEGMRYPTQEIILGFEKRKLKELAREFLNATIQEGSHSSIVDARVALALYRSFQKRMDDESQSYNLPVREKLDGGI
jgi:DNA polymerase III epsilon subunit-like protein